MNSEYITKNPDETIQLGIKFAKKLKKGDIVCITGELGVGKTVFVKGIAKGLGIKERIISPSYILVREYPEKKFYHIDLYRIGPKDFIQSGLEQYLSDENICVIEWADRAKSIITGKCIKVKIELIDKNKRKIIFG
jgi:tRNA threonylcarbamoyladenosine biosynthesis protein TsaE